MPAGAPAPHPLGARAYLPGACQDPSVLEPVLARFVALKDSISAVLPRDPGMAPRGVQQALRYYDDFYQDIADRPRFFRTIAVSACDPEGPAGSPGMRRYVSAVTSRSSWRIHAAYCRRLSVRLCPGGAGPRPGSARPDLAAVHLRPGTGAPLSGRHGRPQQPGHHPDPRQPTSCRGRGRERHHHLVHRERDQRQRRRLSLQRGEQRRDFPLRRGRTGTHLDLGRAGLRRARADAGPRPDAGRG